MAFSFAIMDLDRMVIMKIENLFEDINAISKSLLDEYEYPYEVLPHIEDYILKVGPTLGEDFESPCKDVWIHKSAKVDETAHIDGPLIVDEGAEIRHCAYVRGSVIIGKRCVLGNSCEIKNSILMDDMQVPHFNYVGDSIFGSHSHVGAGVIVSNLKSDKTNVTMRCGEEVHETGLRKVGAFLGDYVEVGCNCVLNPGTVIGRNSRVYPLTMIRGFVPGNRIVKSMDNVIERNDV